MSTTHATSGVPASKQTAAMATMALIGIGYFVIAVVTLHFLRPDYNPIRNFISDYATGPYGFVLTSALFGMSLGSLALVIGLYQILSQSRRPWIGLIFLGLWAAAIMVAGIFRGDLEGAPETPSGGIHVFAALLAYLCLVPAAIVLSSRFKKDERWRPYHSMSLIGSLVVLVTFIGFFVIVLASDMEGGLIQRVLTAAQVAWLLADR